MKIAFTICSTNYLPFAKALADTFMKHNDDYKFSIVLLDKIPPTDLAFFYPHQIIEITQLHLPAFEEMNSKYNIFELSCALKPFVLEYFIKSDPTVEVAVYFDSDILVFNKLAACEEALKSQNVVITPHIIHPLREDGFFPNEEILLRSGLYNAGFIAINNSQKALDFVSWWKERLLIKCYNDMQNGLFVDQIWLSFAPLFFPSISIFKNPGFNVAYWNLQERKLTVNPNYLINGDDELVFFHFSGFDISKPEVISKYQNRFSFETKPEYKILFEEYCNRVMSNGYEEYKAFQPAFGFVKEIIQPKKKPFLKRLFSK